MCVTLPGSYLHKNTHALNIPVLHTIEHNWWQHKRHLENWHDMFNWITTCTSIIILYILCKGLGCCGLGNHLSPDISVARTYKFWLTMPVRTNLWYFGTAGLEEVTPPPAVVVFELVSSRENTTSGFPPGVLRNRHCHHQTITKKSRIHDGKHVTRYS